MPDEEIDFSDIPLITDWSGFRMGLFYRPKWKDFSLKLEEEVIDCLDRGLLDGRTLDENAVKWFEERLVEGRTLDETINTALLDHIRYISFSERVS